MYLEVTFVDDGEFTETEDYRGVTDIARGYDSDKDRAELYLYKEVGIKIMLTADEHGDMLIQHLQR